jgi:hypothetical protein
LPDLKVWRREFGEVVGRLYVIEAVEAVVEGELVEVNGELMLKDGKDQTAVHLQVLKQKVQRDPETGKPQPTTVAEKEAYQRLRARWEKHQGAAPRVRITGPLEELVQGEVPILTVRDFTWPGK